VQYVEIRELTQITIEIRELTYYNNIIK